MRVEEARESGPPAREWLSIEWVWKGRFSNLDLAIKMGPTDIAFRGFGILACQVGRYHLLYHGYIR